MTDNGFGVGDLSGIASAVGAGADGLGGMSAPDLPDAGASSAAVAGAMASMSAVIARIVRTSAVARDQVTAAHSSYVDTDRSAFPPSAQGDPR
jgi:hypothetical protein